MIKIDKEIKLRSNTHYLTTKDLRDFLNNFPDLDIPILYQRIEDVYFEKHGWEPAVKLEVDEDPIDIADHGDYIEALGSIILEFKNGKVLLIGAHY